MLTSSLGECMYRLGIETSAVATPSRAMWMASASVLVSRPAAWSENGISSRSAVDRSSARTTGEMIEPRVRTGPPSIAALPCSFF